MYLIPDEPVKIKLKLSVLKLTYGLHHPEASRSQNLWGQGAGELRCSYFDWDAVIPKPANDKQTRDAPP